MKHAFFLIVGTLMLLPVTALTAQLEAKDKLDLFTTILGYDRPGEVHGMAQYCVAAEGPAEAHEYLLAIAERELTPGWVLRNSASIPGCPWMPSDD